MARHRVRIALALLIAGACWVQLDWIRADRSFSPAPDSYVYLSRLLAYLDGPDGDGAPGVALGELSFRGRPPLYQLLTVPFLAVFGRSEDAATAVNLPFLALLLLSLLA